jgi:hypothetical protein
MFQLLLRLGEYPERIGLSITFAARLSSDVRQHTHSLFLLTEAL